MAMRPNYNQQRGDRNRAKEAKRLEKQKKREEAAQQRRQERGPDDPPPPAEDGN